MGRRTQINWEPIKIMFVSGKTINEIANLFSVSRSSIMQKSMKEKWGLLRKTVKAVPPSPPFGFPPKKSKNASAGAQGLGFGKESGVSNSSTNSSIIEKATFIRNADQFRERVIKQADKALETLEKSAVNNVYETDRFAEALTKVERIGARAYGYDREGDHPVINIGILGTGTEYDPV